MFGRLRRRIEASLANADRAVNNVETNAVEVLDALEDILKEGVAFRLEVAGKQIPVKLIMEPDEPDAARDNPSIESQG
ncbi:MAG: hypothetical protein ACWGQW_06455 [bacterium]